MAVVEAGVGTLQQVGHGRVHISRQPARRRSAAEPMQEASRSLGDEPPLQPLKLADAEVQGLGALRIADLPGQGAFEQPGPRDFLANHRESLPCLHGVTFLLNS